MSHNGFSIKHIEGKSRVGSLKTSRGIIKTPAFMPVGTAGTVKAMLPENVKASPMQNFRTTLSDYYLSLYSRQCDQIDCAACTTSLAGCIS